MVGSRIMKKVTKKRWHPRNNEGQFSIVAIKSLPVEVVASVGSHFFIDLHNLKKCSKDFFDVADDNYVWQRVFLNTLDITKWYPTDKEVSFLERCRKSKNMESLYKKVLREYFKGNNDGLETLKIVAQKGHKEAKYVCGMILLCSKDDEVRKQGLEHMRFLRKSKCVVSCRKKVKLTTHLD